MNVRWFLQFLTSRKSASEFKLAPASKKGPILLRENFLICLFSVLTSIQKEIEKQMIYCCFPENIPIHLTSLEYKTRARGYKTFFMLNSIEHEIFPAHKC